MKIDQYSTREAKVAFNTKLHDCIKNNQLDEVDKLLAAAPSDFHIDAWTYPPPPPSKDEAKNQPNRSNPVNSPLMTALLYGQADIFKYLVEKKEASIAASIAGWDWRFDGQKAPFSLEGSKFSPATDAQSAWQNAVSTPEGKQRLAAMHNILEYIESKTTNAQKDEIAFLNLAFFYIHQPLFERLLNNEAINSNPSLARGTLLRNASFSIDGARFAFLKTLLEHPRVNIATEADLLLEQYANFGTADDFIKVYDLCTKNTGQNTSHTSNTRDWGKIVLAFLESYNAASQDDKALAHWHRKVVLLVTEQFPSIRPLFTNPSPFIQTKLERINEMAPEAMQEFVRLLNADNLMEDAGIFSSAEKFLFLHKICKSEVQSWGSILILLLESHNVAIEAQKLNEWQQKLDYLVTEHFTEIKDYFTNSNIALKTRLDNLAAAAPNAIPALITSMNNYCTTNQIPLEVRHDGHDIKIEEKSQKSASFSAFTNFMSQLPDKLSRSIWKSAATTAIEQQHAASSSQSSTATNNISVNIGTKTLEKSLPKTENEKGPTL